MLTPMKATIRGRVRNTNLPKTKPLMPLFEAVINAFQSIGEAGGSGHSISIKVDRAQSLFPDKLNPITGFSVTDTGVGFTDANYDSFDTIDSQYKSAQGGKGLGRFVWLKAFDRVDIDSDYLDPSGILKRRIFGIVATSDELESPFINNSDSSTPRTVVHLRGYHEPFSLECPRRLEVIAHQLVGHFLRIFLDSAGPAISISDDFESIDLRSFYQENFESTATQHSFTIDKLAFTLRGFRLKGSMAERHELVFAAHSREVVAEKLSGAMPNLPKKFRDEDGNMFTYTAFLESPFLDERVSSDRGAVRDKRV